MSMINISNVISRLKYSRLFKDSFWAVIGSSVGKGLSLLSGIIVARLLGSEVFGEYGLIRNTLLYIAILSTLGLGYSATKYVAEYLKHDKQKVGSLIKSVMTITAIMSVILSLLQFLFADNLAQIINAPYLNKVLRNFSFLVIFNGLTTTQIAILAGLKEFKTTAKINTIAGVITFVGSIALTYFWGLNGALISLTISYIYQCIASRTEINKCVSRECSFENISTNEVKTIVKFSTPLALQDGLYTITHWLSSYILIQFSSYVELGIWSAAGIWLTIVVYIPAVLKNVMFSHFSSSVDHDKLVNKMLLINIVASGLPALLVIFLSNLISSFYGDSFEGIQNVIIVCVVSAIFICIGDVFTYEVLTRNKSWLVFVARLIRDIFSMIALYLTLININSNQAFVFSLISLVSHILYLIIIYIIYKKIPQ